MHEPITAAIVLENTHSDSMGQPLPASYLGEVAAIAHERDAKLHVDGARLFNAVVALGTTAAELLADADSATFCLSKGLACPVGSVVVGTRDFIWRARRARKLVGGGMRQVGVLAAPGLIALRRRPGGHDRAPGGGPRQRPSSRRGHRGDCPASSWTRHGSAPTSCCSAFVARPMIRPRTAGSPGSSWSGSPRTGSRSIDYDGRGVVRAVTHYGIDGPDIDRAIAATRAALEDLGIAGVSRAVPVVGVPS